MTFSTPHGTVRYRLPWSWAAFDYRALCEGLWAQCGHARFETAKVEGRAAAGAVRTDRGTLGAPLIVDALGWRRVLSSPHYQPPEAPLSRGLEVHPRTDGDGEGDALDVWVERDLVRRGYGWRVPAGGEARIGVGSYDPRRHVKEPTVALAQRLDADAVRYQGNWFPHRLRPATEDGVFFAGDSAGHCLPLTAEGIRTAFYFGIAAGRELAAVLGSSQSHEEALRRYSAFSAAHGWKFAWMKRWQDNVWRLRPRPRDALVRSLTSRRLAEWAFGHYLRVAPPEFALPAPPTAVTEPATELAA
jgi:flavin-dependent dehydrogenase